MKPMRRIVSVSTLLISSVHESTQYSSYSTLLKPSKFEATPVSGLSGRVACTCRLLLDTVRVNERDVAVGTTQEKRRLDVTSDSFCKTCKNLN